LPDSELPAFGTSRAPAKHERSNEQSWLKGIELKCVRQQLLAIENPDNQPTL
jgi:hypothetical protein